ncbi:hypothetical protein BsWGS_27364 [Bradybaena similaris]
MDPQRELAVLKYVTILWNRNVTDILDLKDGHFFLQVLDLLDHGDKDRMNTDTDESRLLFVKEFLKDFYGDRVSLDDYLHFKIILGAHNSSLVQVKLELAKIAVVLFGIGVLDKNGKVFMEAALQLPVELQEDILAMIQSVVLPDSTEVVLTDRIEHVLLAADVCSPPVLNILAADNSTSSARLTPHTPCRKFDSLYDAYTPLRSAGSRVNSTSQDLSSPFKYLDIKSPASPSYSPLIDFVQSPQLIQKAVLKQKDLELRKLQEQLTAETLLKEEAQFSLRECQLVRVSQDMEISKLQKRILETDGLQESHYELLELHKKHQEVTAELLSVKDTVEDLLMQKDILEKENFTQTEDILELHRKIKSLEAESQKHKDLLETVQQLELDNKSQEVQLIHLQKLQVQWQEDKTAYNRNLKTAREMNKRLRTELEELQAKKIDNNASVGGETMEVVVDIQMGELRCQLKEATDIKGVLEKQLESSKREVEHLREQIEHDNQRLMQTKEINASLSNALRIERHTIDKMKKRMESVKSKYEDAKVKLESSLKEKEDSAAEVSSLRKALDQLGEQLQKYQQQLQDLLHCSNQLSRDKEGSSPSNQQGLISSCGSLHATHRLSSGYESSICSPGESNAYKESVFMRNNENLHRHTYDSTSVENSLSSAQSTWSCTTSLPSMQCLKKQLSCLLPDGLSCASEPDVSNIEWNRLSQISLSAGHKDDSRLSSISDGTENCLANSTRVTSPLKREIRDVTNCASPPKQRKSGGTVTYFPLDPNGPIYPPPLPLTHARFPRRSIPTPQTASSVTLQTRSKSSTAYPSIATSTTSLNICDRRELPGNSKQKPAASPQRISVATKRPNYRFYHMYKYTVTRKASQK